MRLKLVRDERTFYTDGSCWPNPGPGGWAVIEHIGTEFVRAAGGHEMLTSNVKMEGTAIIEAMSLSDGPVHIITDSLLWVDTLTQWAPQWRANDWRKRAGGAIKNLSMVKQALALYEAHGAVKFTHVRGHQGNPGNEAADVYADEMRHQQEEEDLALRARVDIAALKETTA